MPSFNPALKHGTARILLFVWPLLLLGAFLLAKDVRATRGWLALVVLCAVAGWAWSRALAMLAGRSPYSRLAGVRIGRPGALAVAGVLCALLGAFAIVGVRPAADSARYLVFGQKLFDSTWSELIRPLDIYVILYLVPNVIIGGAERIFGAGYDRAVVLLNIAGSGLITWCYFRMWRLVSNRFTLGQVVLGVFLLFGCYDVVMLNYYVLSDIMFLGLVALFWWALAQWIVQRQRTHVRVALLVALAAMLVRPVGVLQFAFWIIAVGYVRLEGAVPARATVVAIGIGAVAFVVAMIVWPAVLYLENAGVWWAVAAVPDELVPWYQMGAVVCNRPETYLDPPTRYIDYVWITLYKLLYFFFPFRGGYSFAHNAALAVYFPFLWALLPLGTRSAMRLGRPHEVLARLLILYAWLTGLFHSMLYVDYDWRYQLPAMFAMWMIAGYAVVGDRRLPSEAAADERPAADRTLPAACAPARHAVN